MKKLIPLCLLLISPSVLAQKQFLKDAKKINKKIAEQEVEAHIQSGGKTPLAGEHVAELLPTVEVDESGTCAEEEAPGTRYEVIFVAQGNTQKVSNEVVSTEFGPGVKYDLFASQMLKYANDNNGLSEGQLASGLAAMINTRYSTDEDKFNALAAFSSRLQENYNKSRNPGFNTPKNNPGNAPLPGGDLTLNQITKAAFDWSVYDGGVCNDIAEATAMVAEKLFPDKDVLTVNSGSHHGVVVTDGKTNRIIDYGRQYSQVNQLTLKPELTATNMRISKVVDGHLRQIAVADTQTGQLMEQAFQTGKPLLKTNADINSFVTHFKVVNEDKKAEKHELSLGAGVAGLDAHAARMYVFVAKYEYNSPRWRNYIGVGGSAVDFNSMDTRYQLHLRAGTELGIVRYATPKLSLHLTSGLQLEGMYGFKPKSDDSSLQDMAASVEFVNRAGASYRPTPRWTISADAEVRHAVGPESWGNATGVWAGGAGAGILGTLGGLRLHLNQFNAHAGVEFKASDKVKVFADGKYQGSNIGQSVTGVAGVNITAPRGVEILVFSGYSTTKLPGYDTQHSLLVGANGAMVGTGLQTASGISFTGTVTNISADAPPVFSANLSIPLGVPRKKKEQKKKVRSHHLE